MTAMMATKNDRHVDKATNNNKEFVDEVQPLYLVTQTDMIQHFLYFTYCTYQIVTGMSLLHSTVAPQILQKVKKVRSGLA